MKSEGAREGFYGEKGRKWRGGPYLARRGEWGEGRDSIESAHFCSVLSGKSGGGAARGRSVGRVGGRCETAAWKRWLPDAWSGWRLGRLTGGPYVGVPKRRGLLGPKKEGAGERWARSNKKKEERNGAKGKKFLLGFKILHCEF